MRNGIIGLIIGLVVGVVLGVTILTPKIKIQTASKPIVSERDLEKEEDPNFAPVPLLNKGDVVQWRSAPAYPSDRPNVANQAKDFSKQLSIITGDQINLPIPPAKEVLSASRLFAAVASGRIDALFASADIAADKEPALSLFSAIPFGPKPEDILSWLQGGHGRETLEKIFAKHNIHPLVCGYLAPESGGWFVKEINGTEDMKTLRIRINGLGAKVWEKVGASVVDLQVEEIPAAFEQGAIDAAVFSTPEIDARSGFSRFAKNYYFPGWQNQGQPLLLLLNARAWKRLDQSRQSLIKASCDQHTTLNQTKSAQAQVAGLNDLVKQEVSLMRMPSFIVNRLRTAWKDVVAEEARRNPLFRETWEDMNAYIKARKSWTDMGYIPKEQPDY
jgi:TRAP-type mannitol/chloroaromatic compound transport system substrate-binding protein